MATLSQSQQLLAKTMDDFVTNEITPRLEAIETTRCIPVDLIAKLGKQGLLGSLVAMEYGGQAVDYLSYGLIHKAIGGVSHSVRSLLTVHDMVALAIETYGSTTQKKIWLPSLATGQQLAAFALSERQAGNNYQEITTTLEPHSHGFYLNGCKTWISCADLADLWLVFAKWNNQPVALLVPKTLPGIQIKSIDGITATPAARLNHLTFQKVELTEDHILGPIGMGLHLVANTALTLGRYSIAWSNVGLLRSCYLASLAFSQQHCVNQQPLFNYQLTQQKLTNLLVQFKAARSLALEAGDALQQRKNSAIGAVMLAKYFSSQQATQAVLDTIQIHGAVGFQQNQRFHQWLLDAKLTEVIEGSTEIQQLQIAQLYQSITLIDE